jgi:hypothetical protein
MVLGRKTSEIITWIIPKEESKIFVLAVILVGIPFILLSIFARIPISIIEYSQQKFRSKIFYSISGHRCLKISEFLYSSKTQKEVFEPIVADWLAEYCKALSKKEIWKARWINVRYTYAFLVAMWQKSPLGDLIEFISKIAK